MSVQREQNPNSYMCILLFGEGWREREAVGDRTNRCMHGAPLGYKNPHRSGAAGTAGLPHRLPLSPLGLRVLGVGWVDV